jgi:hypothetical protein
MSIDGENQRIESKPAQESARRLREIILQTHSDWDLDFRAIFYHLARSLGSKSAPRLTVLDGDFLARFSELPQDLIALINNSDWESSISTITQSIKSCGDALSQFLAEPGANENENLGRAAARFLGFRMLPLPTSDSQATITPAIQELSIGAIAILDGTRIRTTTELLCCRCLIRHSFNSELTIQLPTSPTYELIRPCMRCYLKAINWQKLGALINGELVQILGDLRAVSTRAFQLGRGHHVWVAAAYFLGIWYSLDSQIQHRNNDMWARLSPPKSEANPASDASLFNRFEESWLPELVKYRSIADHKTRESTGSPQFDPSYAMDPEFRVKTPGSGQTRKDGSHRENRGHK